MLAHKVMAYTSKEPEGFGNFHMYRQDQGGYWSHKPGERQVTDLDAGARKVAILELLIEHMRMQITQLLVVAFV
jgi:hypothetical protein